MTLFSLHLNCDTGLLTSPICPLNRHWNLESERLSHCPRMASKVGNRDWSSERADLRTCTSFCPLILRGSSLRLFDHEYVLIEYKEMSFLLLISITQGAKQENWDDIRPIQETRLSDTVFSLRSTLPTRVLCESLGIAESRVSLCDNSFS